MLNVKNLSFSYSKTPVLSHISFQAQKGENIAIIGESGSGKSTLLKTIYGEYDIDEGEIFWNDKAVLGPKFNLVVGYDFMKYLTQEFDLMPPLSVEDNIGKFLSNFYPEEKKKRTAELIKVVELSAFAKNKVKTLSGGQKQRVALARALAKEPEILLLDEPFSHIDNFKKQSLRRNVFKYLKDKNITCIVATHDKDDVLGFADTMIVLHENKIIAKDTPESLYHNPTTALIASFFEQYNLIDNSLVYAHQLRIVSKSTKKAQVVISYFKGRYFLIEALYNNNTVFIEYHEKLKPGTAIYLDISK
ncbi:ABC transporter ATP-binding protein [Algibacter mikhailovii]|uniref:ABC transporter ATP-binding protein n=1 Tax=Algibacter mikhailovii TaxID=425498 RepID=UPI0024953B9F|nr:ABC transporter ATP-binding protein [Algibacter mikhailovii]